MSVREDILLMKSVFCKIFKCSMFAGFLKNAYLEEHVQRFHVDLKGFPCMYCPKRCATRQDLDRHLVSHRGESLFSCPFCPRKFVHRASLRRHQRSHRGERPYHCHACGKSYGLLSLLQKHQDWHRRKGDETVIYTAPKGQRGILSYIGLPNTHLPINLPATSPEPVSQTAGSAPSVSAETEVIAMDILGLLGNDPNPPSQAIEETLNKIHF